MRQHDDAAEMRSLGEAGDTCLDGGSISLTFTDGTGKFLASSEVEEGIREQVDCMRSFSVSLPQVNDVRVQLGSAPATSLDAQTLLSSGYL